MSEARIVPALSREELAWKIGALRRIAALTEETDTLRAALEQAIAERDAARAAAAKARRKCARIWKERIAEQANARADAPARRWHLANVFLGGAVAGIIVLSAVLVAVLTH